MSHIDGVTHSKTGTDATSGDRIKVSLNISNNKINKISFDGACSSITKASASLMAEKLKGESLAAAERMFLKVREILTETLTSENIGNDVFLGLMIQLKEMSLLQNQSTKCFLLPWKTLYEAIHENDFKINSNTRDYSVFLE